MVLWKRRIKWGLPEFKTGKLLKWLKEESKSVHPLETEHDLIQNEQFLNILCDKLVRRLIPQ